MPRNLNEIVRSWIRPQVSKPNTWSISVWQSWASCFQNLTLPLTTVVAGGCIVYIHHNKESHKKKMYCITNLVILEHTVYGLRLPDGCTTGSRTLWFKTAWCSYLVVETDSCTCWRLVPRTCWLTGSHTSGCKTGPPQLVVVRLVPLPGGCKTGPPTWWL